MKNASLILPIVLLLISCQAPPEKLDLLITNASVIDIQSGMVLKEQLVGIKDQKIKVLTQH